MTASITAGVRGDDEKRLALAGLELLAHGNADPVHLKEQTSVKQRSPNRKRSDSAYYDIGVQIQLRWIVGVQRESAALGLQEKLFEQLAGQIVALLIAEL